MNNNSLFEMFSKFLGQSNFGQFFNNSQNSAQNQQNSAQNSQNTNPAFNNYPQEAYPNFSEQNSHSTPSSSPMDNNMLPFLLSMLGGGNNLSALNSLFKTSTSSAQSSENKKEEEKKVPPSDDILL